MQLLSSWQFRLSSPNKENNEKDENKRKFNTFWRKKKGLKVSKY